MSDSGFLLDTSVLIWWLAEPARLSSAATSCIADPQNQIYCSVVNLWEIQIKVKLGKLDLELTLPETGLPESPSLALLTVVAADA